MNKSNLKYAIIFLIGFVLIGILQTPIAGQVLDNGFHNKAILNIMVFPFQILQLIFLFLMMSYSGELEFNRSSIWYCKERTFHPAFVSAQTFRAGPYIMIFLYFVLFGTIVDWYVGAYPPHYVWIFNNLLILIFVPIVSRWIGQFLNYFEQAVKNVRHILKEEKEFEKYWVMLRRNIFGKKEIIPISIIIAAVKINETVFPDYTWISAGGYVYPLVPLWWSLVAIPVWYFVYSILASISYSYYQFSKSLSQLTERTASSL